jgi:hypothetical protein
MAETSPENCSVPVEFEKYFLVPNGLLSFGYQYHFSSCIWACQKDMSWFFLRTLYCYAFFCVFLRTLYCYVFFCSFFSSCTKWALGLFVVCTNTLESWYLVIQSWILCLCHNILDRGAGKGVETFVAWTHYFFSLTKLLILILLH